MPGMSGRRTNLQQKIDRDVFQIVQSFQDSQPDAALVVHTIYEYIKTSKSSLNRNKKHILESSIERVLEVIQADSVSSDDSIEDVQRPRSPSPNLMNKMIVNNFRPQPPSGASTPGTGKEVQKRRDTERKANGEPAKKKRKQEKETLERTVPTHVRLEEIGGVDPIKRQLKDLLVLPLKMPEEYVQRKIPVPRGILLHGPPGCGKTVLCRAFAAELEVDFIEILGPSVVSGMSGESEAKIREHFEEAKKRAPCLIFIDEIDVIAPKRDAAQSQMEKRIVAQILISMDNLAMESNNGKPVIVLAATNRPDSLDPALRRGGRFDTEINMGVPNEGMREAILRAQTIETRVDKDVDFARLAKMTPGFVGADLRDLVGKAGTWSMDQFREALERQAAKVKIQPTDESMDIDGEFKEVLLPGSEMDKSIKRLIERLKDKDMDRPSGYESTAITMAAFLAVLPGIQPSSKREGFATIPDVTWEDIGALDDVREKLEMAIVEPIKNPARFRRVGITAPSGVLLWGPPGCGKTLLAKAVASESTANFISVKGPELLNKYVGESERAVRQVFTRARSSIPCVLFFDEIDALVPRRDGALSEASSRVVNTLLTELDGLSTRDGIYVIAATNRPDIIDPAMLRPGRLEERIFVGLPGPEERVIILQTHIRKTETEMDPMLANIARQDTCKNFSGADLESLLKKAARLALKRDAIAAAELRKAGRLAPDDAIRVEVGDLEGAIELVKASVQDVQKYERLRKTLGDN